MELNLIFSMGFEYDIINTMNRVKSTQIIKVNSDEITSNPLLINKAGTILQSGGLVAFPTETVYGLGADALNEFAAKQTYAAKGRPSDNPLIIHISSYEYLEDIVEAIPEKAHIMAEKYWPGPMTMVFKKSNIVPYGTTGGLETVAVRMPDHPVAQAIIEAGGGYISAPSANSSGRPSPTLASHVYEDMNGKIDMIVDGGEVEIGVESTILDMTVDPPMILRPGAITKEMIEDVIGEIQVDCTVMNAKSNEAPKAPGMKYRHYAPKAKLMIVDGEFEDIVKAIMEVSQESVNREQKVGIISSLEGTPFYSNGNIKCVGSRFDEEAIAHNLYRVLREFDEEDVDCIYSEAFGSNGIGMATMNRLKKAAGQTVVQATELLRK